VYRLTLCSASECYYYSALILDAVCTIHAHLNHISNFPRETSPAAQSVSKYLTCTHSRTLKWTHKHVWLWCTAQTLWCATFPKLHLPDMQGKTVRWGTCLINLIALSGNAMINVDVMPVAGSCGIAWFYCLAMERSRSWERLSSQIKCLSINIYFSFLFCFFFLKMSCLIQCV